MNLCHREILFFWKVIYLCVVQKYRFRSNDFFFYSFFLIRCTVTSGRNCVHIVCLFLVYIVNSVDMALLIDIESTSCLHRAYLLYPVYAFDNLAMLTNIVSIYIVCILSCLHRRHCRHHDVNQHQADIVYTSRSFFHVYIVDIADIAMLIGIV